MSTKMECLTCNGIGQMEKPHMKTVSIFPPEIRISTKEIKCQDCNGTGFAIPDVPQPKDLDNG